MRTQFGMCSCTWCCYYCCLSVAFRIIAVLHNCVHSTATCLYSVWYSLAHIAERKLKLWPKFETGKLGPIPTQDENWRQVNKALIRYQQRHGSQDSEFGSREFIDSVRTTQVVFTKTTGEIMV